MPFRSPPGGRPHAERPDHADAVAAPAGALSGRAAAAGFTPIDPPGCHRLSESDLIAALSDADALLAGGDPVTGRMIRSAPRLRAIARTGVGYESVDLAAASERRIPVAITPGANHDSVAEHALALMLALTRNLLGNDRMVRDGGWERRPVRPLRGTTLGIVGLGRIGRALATRARALGMEVLAFDRNADAVFDADFGMRRAAFEAVLEGSDVVSICLPLSPSTRGLFDRHAFARMRTGAILVNTAHGGLVVEADLYEALASGHLAGAGWMSSMPSPPAGQPPLESAQRGVQPAHCRRRRRRA